MSPAGASLNGLSSNAPFNGAGRRGPAVVAFGGGHGLAASLAALRADHGPAHGGRDGRPTTAARRGGCEPSWTRYRWETCGWRWRRSPGATRRPRRGRTCSSTASWRRSARLATPSGTWCSPALAGQHGSPVAALDLAAALLGAAGRVLPLSTKGIDIVAEVAGLDVGEPNGITEVRGQAAVATTPGRVVSLRLEPAAPPVCATGGRRCRRRRVDRARPRLALHQHDAPPAGSRDVQAGHPIRAGRVLVLNLAAQPGETEGYPPEAHLDVLGLHVPDLTVDVVVADPSTVPDVDLLARAAADLGGAAAPRAGRCARPPVARPDPTRGRLPGDLHRIRTTVRRPPFRAAGVPEKQGVIDVAAMTATVKDELSRLRVAKPCCRRAEMAALLRFGGGLHIVSGRIVVEAELDTGSTARRLRREIAEVFGFPSTVAVLAAGGLRRSVRYIVRVERDGEQLARSTGLLDQRGRPVRGLPPQVVTGSSCDAAAAWRGAFLAHGSLTEPGALVLARGHFAWPGGRARPGRCRAPARRPGQEPGRAGRRPGGDP